MKGTIQYYMIYEHVHDMIIMYIKFSLKSVSCCCINVKLHNSMAYLSNDSCIISTNRETSCSEHLAIKYIIAGL